MYIYRASLIAQLVKKLPAMQEAPGRLLGREDPLKKGQLHDLLKICRYTHTHTDIYIYMYVCIYRASLIAQLVKNPTVMQETLVQLLGWEDSLEKGQATHSSITGLPLWFSRQRIHLQSGRPGFNLWVGKYLEKGKATHSSIIQ